MNERVRFIARGLDGEAMSRLCEELSISRKTGYKILQRHRDCGVEGLTDRSRRPFRQPISQKSVSSRVASLKIAISSASRAEWLRVNTSRHASAARCQVYPNYAGPASDQP